MLRLQPKRRHSHARLEGERLELSIVLIEIHFVRKGFNGWRFRFWSYKGVISGTGYTGSYTDFVARFP